MVFSKLFGLALAEFSPDHSNFKSSRRSATFGLFETLKIEFMAYDQIMEQLKEAGSEQIKKILLKHNCKEPLFGVKVEELKKIQKVVKKDHSLSMALYDSGNYDAMYLAGLIADEKVISKADLQHWVENSKSPGIAEYTVPWIAAESRFGMELALEWIDSPVDTIAGSGWSTISSVVAITADKDLDIPLLKKLLARIKQDIQKSTDAIKGPMNKCVIAIGTYATALTDEAKAVGEAIGPVTIDVGDTACKIPYSVEYIQKAVDKGGIGKKKKMARC
jgi:3-methyladenine DNA glycosylase AlkD